MVNLVIGTNYYTAIGLFGTCGIMLLGLFSTYPAIRAYEKGRSFLNGIYLVFSFSL